jgi:oxalate decarboxylase/phosphoglucose isomerase-like protein (cupin superfamily)
MKTPLKFLLGILFVAACTPTFAQDWVKVAPVGKDIKIDNNIVRTIVVTLNPGEKEAQHTHPAHVYYVLTAGKAKVQYSDGKEVVAEIKAGDCGYSDPERPHTLQNIGENAFTFLVIELKEHPYSDK